MEISVFFVFLPSFLMHRYEKDIHIHNHYHDAVCDGSGADGDTDLHGA